MKDRRLYLRHRRTVPNPSIVAASAPACLLFLGPELAGRCIFALHDTTGASPILRKPAAWKNKPFVILRKLSGDSCSVFATRNILLEDVHSMLTG